MKRTSFAKSRASDSPKSNGNGNGNGHGAKLAPAEPVERAIQNFTLPQLLQPLASLRLTVVLLALSMVLIFAGTTVQTEMGIWDVQRRYFHTWVTLIEWRLFFPLWDWGNKNIPGSMPFPGGYTLIALLLLNLIAAHSVRFKITWKRSGILLIHSGMILLLAGEVITAEKQIESQMTIDVGTSVNFAADSREVELAITDQSPADHDREVVVPIAKLLKKGTIQHPSLPFSIAIDDFYPNSTVMGPEEARQRNIAPRANAGHGTEISLVPVNKGTGVDGGMVDRPSAYVTLSNGDGQGMGTYLLSTIELLPRFPQIHLPQTIEINGKTYGMQLRFRRYYKDYTVHLLKFSHDRYTGTDVPKNFSSLVRLVDPKNNVDRESLIWMNHPLRYNGETFFQASFKPGDQTTILQVVRNPGWLIPYISCSMIGLGMIIHFGMHLLRFLSKGAAPAQSSAKGRKIAPPSQVAKASWVPAALTTGFCALYVLSHARAPEQLNKFDLNAFSRTPVLYEGRVMPLDSLARNCLRIISGKSRLTTEDGKRPAIEWLTDVFAHPDRAADHKVFRIDHPDVLDILGFNESKANGGFLAIIGMQDRELYSIRQISAQMPKLQEQHKLAFAIEAKKRDHYQRSIIELGSKLMLVNRLADMGGLYLSPPIGREDWRTFREAVIAMEQQGQRDAGAGAVLSMVEAHHDNKADEFNAAAMDYRALLHEKLPDIARKLDVEVLFNRISPFISSIALYVIVFVLAAASWVFRQGAVSRAALWVLVLALVVHSLGLVTRIYLQGRPPVTNLYSSAIFIAWAVVLFCVVMELIYRNGLACAAASAIAFPSLLIANALAGDGDTMKMLQAVLDTNIWLATHVVVVILGYTAAFLAGFLAIAYILGGTLTRALAEDGRKTIAKMIYGVVCFAMLFSFVGTILGGIWADQSWGRFWGWDPKENGAVLIVLWNAIILHARWGGLVRERGMAMLAIFGNIVTSWSWFGTNMLGVGLHSYGFMDSALFWLVAFATTQLVIIAMGGIPLHRWRSYANARGIGAQAA